MKYANYDKTTGKLLGWYSPEINGTYVPAIPAVLNTDGTVKTPAVPAHYDTSNIPTPNLEVTDEQWQSALDNGYNYIDATNKTLSRKDFRTFVELQTAKLDSIKSSLKTYLEFYTLADGTIVKNNIQDQANNLKDLSLSQLAIHSPKWEASVSVALNSVAFIGNTLCICTTAGKTNSSEPTAPIDFSTALSDGTAVWKKLGFLVNTGKGRVYYTPQDILKISQEVALILNEALTKYDILKGQIKACTTEDELSKITW